MLRVVTLNLNGIRSAYRKGLEPWLRSINPDIVCWQEVRASEEDLSDAMRSPASMFSGFNLPQKKGYSGVAILSKKRPRRIIRALGNDIMDNEGRFLCMDFAGLSVISLYMPSGSSGEARQKIKYSVMAFMDSYMDNLRKKADKTRREFLICGDINIAHTEKDIKNWRGNRKNSGFLPEERAWLTRLFTDGGWRDVFRSLNDEDEYYTWWSNRGRAWQNNVGWRIDYQLATPKLAAQAYCVSIYKEQRFSDHAPLIIDYRRRW